MKNKLYIYGCGGHGRSVAEVALFNYKAIGIVFVDPNAKPGEKIWGFPVVRKMPPRISDVHYAIGDNRARQLRSAGKGVSLIAGDAYVSAKALVGSGAFVGHRAYIGPGASVGAGSIINTAAILEHETRIGDYCHVSVGSVLCGRCEIGDRVFVGARAVLKDKIKICSDVVIGAGAVVVKDIVKRGLYIGCPAKKARR